MARMAEIRRELRATLLLAVPIVFGQVGQMLMGITDSVMIGQVGTVPLAASAFANGVCNFFYIVGAGLLLSVAVLTARAHGASNPKDCAEYLRHGTALAIGFSAAVTVVLGMVAWHLEDFGQPPEVVAAAGPYFSLLTASLVPSLLFQAHRQFSEALGRPWAPMAILLGCVLLNVGLNWIFIYGHLGAPALGLTGAGIATLIARAVAAAGLWIWLRSRESMRAEMPGANGNPRWRAPLERARMNEMLRIGVPAAGQWMFEVGAFAAAALMMGWLGTVPLAAHQVALSCAGFTFMFPLGLSAAVSVRLSQAIGAGREHSLRVIGFGALAVGVAVMAGFGLIFGFGGSVIARAFTSDAEVVMLSSKLLFVAGLFQLCDGAQVVSAGALRGLSDVKIPTVITLVAYWVLALPGGYALAFAAGWGGMGVWTGLALGLAFAAVTLGWRFHRLTGQAPNVSS